MDSICVEQLFTNSSTVSLRRFWVQILRRRSPEKTLLPIVLKLKIEGYAAVRTLFLLNKVFFKLYIGQPTILE